MDIVEVVRGLGGTATRAQLVPPGRAALEAALRDGSLVRVGRGVFALPGAPPALHAAAARHGVVSHTSAAQLWFLETVHAPERPHVTLPRGRNGQRTPDAGAVHLHWADLPAADVRNGVTSPLRTLVDCARDLPFPEALAVADSALRHGLLTPAALLERAVAGRGAGRQAVLRVARSADARAANPFESALRGIVLDAGLTGFRPQVLLRSWRLTARVDLGDVRLKIALEADSFAWHGDRAALARDCRRYDELVAAGWLVLRFAWEQVMSDQAWVARTVLAACRHRERRLRPRRRQTDRQKSA